MFIKVLIMKRKLTVLVFTILLFQFGGAMAQQGKFYQFKLIKETKVRGSKIFYKGLENRSKESQIDVDGIIQKKVGLFTRTYGGIEKKKIQNHNAWTKNPLFEMVNSTEVADVIIGGYYLINTHVEIQEKLFYERQTNVGGAIPYYEIRQTNAAEVEVVISYTYKDKSVDYDTIRIVKQYERKPNTKYISVNQLLERCEKELVLVSDNLFRFYSADYIWYKFQKVKTKDKALKEELKGAGDMLAAGEIYKLGSLYKRIYEADKTNKTAAFNLAMCYELIGNYPKAMEYYSEMPDFHVKVRMKENNLLFDYLKSIGANMILNDF